MNLSPEINLCTFTWHFLQRSISMIADYSSLNIFFGYWKDFWENHPAELENFRFFRFSINFHRPAKIFLLNRFEIFWMFWKAMILIRSFLLSKSRRPRLRHPLVPSFGRILGKSQYSIISASAPPYYMHLSEAKTDQKLVKNSQKHAFISISGKPLFKFSGKSLFKFRENHYLNFRENPYLNFKNSQKNFGKIPI